MVCNVIKSIVFVSVVLTCISGNEIVAGEKEFKNTEVVASFSDEIVGGNKNYIWCSSFISAWKYLKDSVLNEDVSISNNIDFCMKLNEEANLISDLPGIGCKMFVGFSSGKISRDKLTKGVSLREINDECLNKNFKPFVIYSLLESDVKFSKPFKTSKHWFNDGSDAKKRVRTFGLYKKDADKYRDLRKQVRILWLDGVDYDKDRIRARNFAVDLDCYSEDQGVVALSSPGKSLLEMYQRVEKRTTEQFKKKNLHGLGDEDVLMVPDVSVNIVKSFKNLVNEKIENKKLLNVKIGFVNQEIAI